VFVWVDAAPDATQDTARDAYRDASQDALLSAKDETIAALREQLAQANERDRENRRIIAALTSRIPAIEAPEAPQGPEPGDQGEDRGNVADSSVVVREMGTSAAGELIAKVVVEVLSVGGGVFPSVVGRWRMPAASG
jgi:hypothetical protein